MNGRDCEVRPTPDEGWRRGHRVPLKANADAGMASSATIKTCVVIKRTGGDITMKEGRDLWAEDVMKGVSDDPASCT